MTCVVKAHDGPFPPTIDHQFTDTRWIQFERDALRTRHTQAKPPLNHDDSSIAVSDHDSCRWAGTIDPLHAPNDTLLHHVPALGVGVRYPVENRFGHRLLQPFGVTEREASCQTIIELVQGRLEFARNRERSGDVGGGFCRTHQITADETQG